jgi:hypothetical protein
MLSAIVPEVTAGACCGDAGKVYMWVSCGCVGPVGAARIEHKWCTFNCTCKGLVCGPCVATATSCR